MTGVRHVIKVDAVLLLPLENAPNGPPQVREQGESPDLLLQCSAKQVPFFVVVVIVSVTTNAWVLRFRFHLLHCSPGI